MYVHTHVPLYEHIKYTYYSISHMGTHVRVHACMRRCVHGCLVSMRATVSLEYAPVLASLHTYVSLRTCVVCCAYRYVCTHVHTWFVRFLFSMHC